MCREHGQHCVFLLQMNLPDPNARRNRSTAFQESVYSPKNILVDLEPGNKLRTHQLKGESKENVNTGI